MYILDVCENGDILSAFKTVNLVINIIKIAVPIILILSVMIDYVKALKNAEEITMTNKMFVNKIMAAIIVFFVPFFVDIIINTMDPEGISYIGCLHNANDTYIANAFSRVAQKNINSTRETLLHADYNIAMSSIRKIKDDSLRIPLENELKELDGIIKLSEEIDKLAKDFDGENYKDLKERIDAIGDDDMRERLQEKLKDSLHGMYSEYPINPDDPFYSNLSFLINQSLEDFLKSKGSSVDLLNEHIRSSVVAAGVGTRQGTVAAAMTLIGDLAQQGKKLNYQWGGKFESLGARSSWGTTDDMSWLCSSASYGALYDSSHCFTHYKWKSFDCSGFVTWAVINGMQNSNITQSNIFASRKVPLNYQKAVCQPGEALDGPGHIVLVVGIDEPNKRYIIAESSGSNIYDGHGGVHLSYYSFGKLDWYCLPLNNIYGN